MTITLTVQSIEAKGSTVLITAIRSDTSKSEYISVDSGATMDTVKTAIKNRVLALNATASSVEGFQSLINQVFGL